MEASVIHETPPRTSIEIQVDVTNTAFEFLNWTNISL